MKPAFFLSFVFLLSVTFLFAQEFKPTITYSEVEKKLIKDYGYSIGIVGHNEKYIITQRLKTFSLTKSTDLSSLDFYDRNTLKFVKNVIVFKPEPKGDSKQREFNTSMVLTAVHSLNGKLFIFSQRTNKEKKNKEEILYCTMVDENDSITEYFKEVISAPYQKGKYGSIEIKVNESAKQILLIAQPETEPNHNVYINTKLYDYNLHEIVQGFIELPFKVVPKKGRMLIPIDYHFNDNRIYSFTFVKPENDEKDAEEDYVKTITVSDITSKKTVVIPLDFNGRKVHDIAMHIQNNEMKVTGFYQNVTKKEDGIWVNGFFNAVVDKETGLLKKTVFSEFTPRQIADLSVANNLEKDEKLKEKDIKAGRVDAWLTIADIVLSDDKFIIVSEYKHNYRYSQGMGKTGKVSYTASERGSVCLFSFSNEGKLESVNSYKRFLYNDTPSATDDILDLFHKRSLYVFESKNKDMFNIMCDANGVNFVLAVNVHNLEIQYAEIKPKDFNGPKNEMYYMESSYVVDDKCYFSQNFISPSKGGMFAFDAGKYNQYFVLGKIEN